MIVYSVVMVFTAIVVGVIAAQILKGKTDWIHDYHRTRVKDHAAYGKAFGKALCVMAVAMALSGGIALLGESAMRMAVLVLLIGLLAGIIAIIRVQKKYNGGVF